MCVLSILRPYQLCHARIKTTPGRCCCRPHASPRHFPVVTSPTAIRRRPPFRFADFFWLTEGYASPARPRIPLALRGLIPGPARRRRAARGEAPERTASGAGHEDRAEMVEPPQRVSIEADG